MVREPRDSASPSLRRFATSDQGFVRGRILAVTLVEERFGTSWVHMKHPANSSSWPAIRQFRNKLRVLAAVLCAGAATFGSNAAENWMFSTAVALPSPINLPGTMSGTPWLSSDGLTLYFASNRPGGYGKFDLWVATRNTTDENWGEPVNLGPSINTSAAELMPCLSADGLTLYFGDGNPFGWTARNGTSENYQIWTATRDNLHSPWSSANDLGPPVGTKYIESYPHVSRDGLSLFFTSTRPGLPGLYVARRATPSDPWLAPIGLGSKVNQGSWTGFPFLSNDGLRLLCYSDRAGGQGGYDLWMSSRSSLADEWLVPVNLGAQVNSSFYDLSPCVSADFPALGSSLLFARNDANEWNEHIKIYGAVVIPKVSVLRSGSVNGPWNLVLTATFSPLSARRFQCEVPVVSVGGTTVFYQITKETGGSIQIESLELVGRKIRLDYTIE
ncbi:MAG TPA: hypothetical protein DCE44_25305 [Verrucomicrobiales bacterium]|nr:hypothetical protein [Verrucomicrobiales bacterium]